jgi:uncharacterized protein YdaU (DUF1376 family)
MKNPPSFQFYPQDFLADINVQAMTMEERGIYITLLCHCWIEDGLPIEEESRLVDEYFKKSSAVAQCFIEKDCKYRNPRLDLEREKQRKWREKCSIGGLHSAESKTLLKRSSTKGQLKAKKRSTLPLHSSSSSSSSLEDSKESSFISWWEKYPRKKEKPDAIKAYAAALKGCAPSDLDRALDAYLVEIKRLGTEEKFIKHPATFLRADRWRDYLDMPTKMPLKVGESGDVASSVARAVAKNRKNFPELEEK